MGIEADRKMALAIRTRGRIEANRIVGIMGFRQRFSSHEFRHAWDLCGHPVYWWVMKCAVETKYIEKILLWTDDPDAGKAATEMSDKFVVIPRSVEECKEPLWKFVDDRKSMKSRVNHIRPPFEGWSGREKELEEALGFEPTLFVFFASNQPLIRAKSLTRLIELYFEDDIAESAHLAIRDMQPPYFFMPDPGHPEYMVPCGFYTGRTGRQERPTTLTPIGHSIVAYKSRIYSIPDRMLYLEVGENQWADIHDEDDLELARLKMEKRLQDERK